MIQWAASLSFVDAKDSQNFWTKWHGDMPKFCLYFCTVVTISCVMGWFDVILQSKNAPAGVLQPHHTGIVDGPNHSQ